MSGYMVQHRPKQITVLLYALSMLITSTLKILQTLLISSHTVAIRPGNHCAQILHRTLGIDSSARASLYFYSTKEEVDVFIHALKRYN
ncbi:hypothetical protein HU200_062755 [Digitaria exilis]|uniref:Aminotransferase class V domain-containing protein n=1 Tax=Digitaria exilis TaxID=1010633 RepID=A0A835DWW3_9POAL|nr:hypothetical protein HU200_062755 [Digitaria exilis]